MEVRSKKRMMRRRSLKKEAAFACAELGAACVPEGRAFNESSNLVCSTVVGGNASVFSISKDMTCCVLLSSTTVKSPCLRSRTKFPLLSRTVTFTNTRSVSAWKVYPVVCCEGSGGDSKATVSARASVWLLHRFAVTRVDLFAVICSSEAVHQKRKRAESCMVRMDPTPVTRP